MKTLKFTPHQIHFHTFLSVAVLCLLSSILLPPAWADAQKLPVKVRNPNYKLVEGKRFKNREAKTNAVEIVTYAISIDTDSEIYMVAVRHNLLKKIGDGDVDGAITLLDAKSRTLATRKPPPKLKKQK